MSDEYTGFMSRIGRIFGFGKTKDGSPTTEIVPGEPRLSLLRPFSKRDQAIANLQDGFSTLTDLMTSIKENLNDQGRRQDELLSYLSHLPKAIEGIPETNRLQVESLKAISLRLEQQNSQQNLIGEILGKLADSDGEQKKVVEDVRSRVETVAEQNKTISDNLSSVGSAMQTVSRNSQASAQVLEQVRDNIEKRDGHLERMMHKQAARFTWMLLIAIFLSISALVAVVIVLLQVVNKPASAAPTTAGAEVHGTP
jgi:archaellum component FlaC